MKEITIGIKEPAKDWRIETVEDALETYQGIVGGYIEHVGTASNGIEFFANEEGKLQGLLPNFGLHGELIVGTAFAVRGNDEGEFQSLEENDINWLTQFPQYL